MDFLFNLPLITPALGFIMRLCYSLVGNVGVAIIVFTIIIRIVMFPLSVKQQKNTSKTQIFAPRLREIQQKYRGNTQMMQAEMAKLQKEGYNPASGCLPTLATMLILFGVLGVVYSPLTYFERIDDTQLEVIESIAIRVDAEGIYAELIDQHIMANPVTLDEPSDEDSDTDTSETVREPILLEYEDIDEEVRGELRATAASRAQIPFNRIQSQLEIMRVFRENPEAFSGIDSESRRKMEIIQRRIVFAGIDFSETPTRSWPTIMIPLLSFIFAAGQTIIMQYVQKKTSPEAVKQMGMMRYMMYGMPIMSLVIAFQFPAGAGFYWAISGAVGIIQSLVIFKIWPPDKLREEVMAALDSKGGDNVVVIEKHDGRKVEKKASQMSGKEEKEYYRKKLEEARKADLKKYGEVGELPPEVSEKLEKLDQSEEPESFETPMIEVDSAVSVESQNSDATLITCKDCGATNDNERQKCRSCGKKL
ncbi:MAG: membrane protein insertase YidC [Oscillospiraceae bacterium]|nr:membrane protein insertase YidC [Oscillospiraceae bacterium]